MAGFGPTCTWHRHMYEKMFICGLHMVYMRVMYGICIFMRGFYVGYIWFMYGSRICMYDSYMDTCMDTCIVTCRCTCKCMFVYMYFLYSYMYLYMCLYVYLYLYFLSLSYYLTLICSLLFLDFSHFSHIRYRMVRCAN